MKDFYQFKQFLAAKGNLLDKSIDIKVKDVMQKSRKFPDAETEKEFYEKAVLRQTILEYIEQYHNWLHSPENSSKK